MLKFPATLDNVLQEISKENNFGIRRETHYETIDREIYWFNKNIQFRINFTILNEDSIKVTFLKDKFRFNPKMSLWLHKNVPMFPYCADVTCHDLGVLLIQDSANYHDKVNAFLKVVKNIKYDQ